MWRVLILIVPMTACTQFPELDALIGDDIKGTPYPKLVPIEPILNLPEGQSINRVAIENTLTTRVADLKARGAALRGDVIDRKTRQRIAQGVKTPDSARNR